MLPTDCVSERERDWVQSDKKRSQRGGGADPGLFSSSSATLITYAYRDSIMQSVTKVKHIPQGYHSVSPYLVVDGAAKLIDFVKQTFNAAESARMDGPQGHISHAEVKIGDSIIMLSDSTPEYKAMPAMLYVYVEDVDAVYKKALQAGATSVSEPKNQFYGDRSAGVKDPLGNHWGIATHVEEVPPEEMQRRMKEQANQ